MTTSGDYTSFNPAVTELVTEAFRDCDIINEDEEPTAEQYSSAIFRINSIVAGMQATGIHVWTQSEAILFLQPRQARYIIGGPVVANNAFTADDSEWLQLATTTSLGAGVTTIPYLASTQANGIVQPGVGAPLATGNLVGFVLASGSMWWTTIGVGTITPFTFPIAAPLPSAVNAQATVVTYPAPSGIVRPLKVPHCHLLTFGGAGRTADIEIEMTMIPRQRYDELPNKTSPGTPTMGYYSPQLGYGVLSVWPTPVTITQAVRMTWYRPLASFLEPNNTADFPQEWSAPLRYLLADELKLSYAVPEPRASRIEKKAMEWTTIVSGWDRDPEPIEFGMDYRFGT